VAGLAAHLRHKSNLCRSFAHCANLAVVGPRGCGKPVKVCTSHLRGKRDLCTKAIHLRELALVGTAGIPNHP
jgi:hypothetical protein